MGKNGGNFGKAMVAFFDWNFRTDDKARVRSWDPKVEDSLVPNN
jgi:hypothetical protein